MSLSYRKWTLARLLWGRLQQVKKGTRVKCWLCRRQVACGCPLCGNDGFVDRNDAIRHCEFEMELEWK